MWLCGCLGQRGGRADVQSEAVNGAQRVGQHVVVKTNKPAAAAGDTHTSDVQDKDQGHAAARGHEQQEQHQYASPQLGGSGHLTPRNQLWQDARMQTWSPSHVSLDMPGLQHGSIRELQKQERMLRALFDKISKFSHATHGGIDSMHTVQIQPQQLNEKELLQLKQLILQACSVQRPGQDAYGRVSQLLQELHAWVIHAGQGGASAGSRAVMLLHDAGEALAHAEHFARSAGQVQFWGPAVVRQWCTLMRVYATLLEQCTPVLSGKQASTASSCGSVLLGALVQLLVRPSLVELLGQVLQLVHLDQQFRVSVERHEAVGAAVAVLEFLRDIVRLARAHVLTVGDKRLSACVSMLATMLCPPHGLLPRLLQQQLTVDNATIQLQALLLMQQLFETPTEVLHQLLRPQLGQGGAAPVTPATFYLTYHTTEAARCYFASGGDPTSACAELCLLHVRLLRALCRGGASPALVGAGPAASAAALRVNELLLSELAAEYEAAQAAALLASQQDEAAGSTGLESDGSSESGDPIMGQESCVPVPGSGVAAMSDAAVENTTSGSAERKADSASQAQRFEFTYDLNEDLARILELEEKLGESVEVDGFEYDQEGKQLLQRNSVMAAEAAVAEAGSAAAPAVLATGLVARRSYGLASSSRPLASSEGGRPSVPKLSFSSFTRSALSSSRSIVAPSSTAPSAAPSARAMASPARLSHATHSSAVPIIASSAPVADEPALRHLQLHHIHTAPQGLAGSSSAPGSPTAMAVHHVLSHISTASQHLAARHSPSRLSVSSPTHMPNQQGQRRRSSSSFAGDMAGNGPFAQHAVHFKEEGECSVRNTPSTAAAGAAAAAEPPITTAVSRSSTASTSSTACLDVGIAVMPSTEASGRLGSTPPPVPRLPVPVLDLSGLGSSSKNSRSAGGASSTGRQDNSRRGSAPASAKGKGEGSATGTGRGRHIPDSASDAAGKVLDGRHTAGCAGPSCADATAIASASCTVSSPSLRGLTVSASGQRSQRSGHGAATPATVSSALPSAPPSNRVTSSITSSAVSSFFAGSAAASGVSVPTADIPAGGDPMQRLMFRDPKLHTMLLMVALEASITPSGQLDPLHWQQYPLDNGARHNLEYMLTWHLNNVAGATAVPELHSKLKAAIHSSSTLPATMLTAGSPGPSTTATAPGVHVAQAQLRLLRLLSKAMFESGRYSELKFLARGAFSNVYRAKARLPASAAGALGSQRTEARPLSAQRPPSGTKQQQQQQQVIIKTVALPGTKYDRCVLPDMYGEIAIMEQYQGCPGICQMLDYGLTDDAYWIVMRKYRCSLAEWRQRQSLGPANASAAALYLSILLQVVAALKILARDSVVHFDLKCSNVLIDPHPGARDSEIWNPLGLTAGNTTGPPASVPAVPFDAVLADFGEARSYRNADEAFTVRNRGTEVYKSPEMLLLNTRAGAEGPAPPAAAPAAAAKAALQGAGLASDVWSLGCLAYELLTGKVLFGGDYASVTHRVAFGGRGNLCLTAAERTALGDRAPLISALEWILARDPVLRPSLEAIEGRLRDVQRDVLGMGMAPAP